MKKAGIPIQVFLLIVFAVCIIPSCRSIPQMQKGSDLALKSAYLQKEVPGQEHMKIKDYLVLALHDYDKESCTIDSVYYLKKAFRISDNRTDYKILLDGGFTAQDTAFVSSLPDVATLFYHKQSAAYYLKLDGINRKEPIYLP